MKDLASNRRDGVAVRPAGWWRVALPCIAYWAALMPLTYFPPRHSGNVWSRYMTIESLVERGTFAVDRSPLRAISGSPDLIKVGQRRYSDKPPVLSTLAAGVYYPLHAAGQRFAGSAESFVVVNAVLVSVVVGLTSALALAGTRVLLQYVPIRPITADALTLAFGFGSLLLSYGVTFNNHSVAAGLLTLALAIVVVEGPAVAAGVLTGLAAVIDLPAGGAMLLALGALSGWRSRGALGRFALGAVGPLVLHAALQTVVTGSPLPAELNPAVFSYEGSYWNTAAGRWVEPGPRWQFGLELLFGPQGWLTVTPILGFGVVGLIGAAVWRGGPLRPAAIAVGSVLVVLIAYYTWGVRRTDFSGQSFGARHLLAISPAVYVFGVDALGHWKSRFAWVTFAALWGVGLVFAAAGMRDPWSRIERREDMGLELVKRTALYPWSSYRR